MFCIAGPVLDKKKNRTSTKISFRIKVGIVLVPAPVSYKIYNIMLLYVSISMVDNLFVYTMI